VMAGVWMLFMATPGVGAGYLWTWLLVVYFGFSITVLSHTSWAATLSAEYHQRSRIYAYWQTGNVIGMILILALPVVMALMKMGGGTAGGVQAQGLIIVIALPLMVALALWRVDEPRQTAAQAAMRATLGDYFRLLKRPTVLRILTTDLLMGLAPGVAGTLFFFYFMRVKAFDRIESLALLLIYFVAAIAGAVLWTRLAHRFGKSRTLVAACLVYAAVQVGVVFLPAGNFLLAIPFLVAAGIPYSAAPTLLRAMMADYGDEERLASGADRTGLLYAILTGTVKIGAALAASSLILLGWLGFDAANPAASTATSMMGLQVLYAVVPGAIGVLAALALVGYPLTEARHTEIRRLLGDKDAAPPPVPPEDALPLNVAAKPAE
jgi:glycoside/pentoside/hexuronide:cation symporter, GPH family